MNATPTKLAPECYLQAEADHLASQHGSGGGAITSSIIGAASHLHAARQPGDATY